MPAQRPRLPHEIGGLGRSDYVLCRSLGHLWEPFAPIGLDRPRWGIRLSLLCTRCGMERHDLVDTLGEVASRRYEQPTGYSLSGMDADLRPSRKDYRSAVAKEVGDRGVRLSRPEDED